MNITKATTYTYTAAVGGDPSVKTNWSPALTSFTVAGTTYNISKSVTMGAAWTVSGAGSKVAISTSGTTISDGGFTFTSTGIT
ncbi:MAG TPA: hypothetical protein VKG26_04625, partial [Bacteroidia bacterium]|nr:hypothetical protein [Bacteroidia bacterium]